MNIKRVKRKTGNFIRRFNGILGDVSNSLATMYTGDPTGIVGLAVKETVCKTLENVSSKLDNCQLTEWEIQRVTNCMKFSIERIEKNIKEGRQIREDDFFKEKFDDRRSDAEEVFESIVIASQRESQEMKQLFYGNILANIGFQNNVGADEVNFIIKVFEKLTYRQCLLLSMFYYNNACKRQKIESVLINTNLIGMIEEKDVVLYQEILDLYNKSLIFNKDASIIFNIAFIIPNNLITYGLGNMIIQLSGLDRITDSNSRLSTKHLSDLKDLYDKFVDNSIGEIILEKDNLYIIDKRAE